MILMTYLSIAILAPRAHHYVIVLSQESPIFRRDVARLGTAGR